MPAGLCRATTFYVTTTKAEGNCLPVMDYLAAGRPAVSPCHTALGDYFGPDVGFVVESHPEPAASPQDRRLRIRYERRPDIHQAFLTPALIKICASALFAGFC